MLDGATYAADPSRLLAKYRWSDGNDCAGKGFVMEGRQLASGRLGLAVGVGVFGAALIWYQYQSVLPTDFGVIWFGAKSLLGGVDPYPLVGKGKDFDYQWPQVYPATAFVSVLPLGLLSERIASSLFVGASSFGLAWGILKHDKHYLLPLFLTEPFLNSARLGQFNIILTAALFFPALGIFAACKPQSATQLILRRESWRWIALGGLFLLAVSILLLPSWPREWLSVIRQMTNVSPPITYFGGFLVLLGLFRWRERDVWLILILALTPQTMAFYSALPLLTVPRSWKESTVLCSVVMLGGFVAAMTIPEGITKEGFYQYYGGTLIFTLYLPAVFMVLRRKRSSPETRSSLLAPCMPPQGTDR